MPGTFATRMMLEAIRLSGAANLANERLRGIGSILMLHRVSKAARNGFSPNAHLTVTPKFLDQLGDALSRSIFEFVSMDEAARRIREKGEGGNGRPFVAVTLDDGYRDNLENAVPVFRKYKIPYTIFVAPGLVDGRASLWWEDLEAVLKARETLYFDWKGLRQELPLSNRKEKQEAFDYLMRYLTTEVSEEDQRRIVAGLCEMSGVDAQTHRAQSIMSWAELKELARDPLCTLGAHTIGHYALARLSAQDAQTEFEESRALIELETGVTARHFAYPYGYPAAAGEREFAMAAGCGYETAVTTRHGVVYPEHADHLTALPRISLNGNFQKLRYVRALLSGTTTRLVNKGKRLNVA